MTAPTHEQKILLAHGGGGQLSEQLIREHILPKLTSGTLGALPDSATLRIGNESICFTTDSYVVKPLFFEGGDIGKLAVCGTVNDLAVAGAKPIALSLSFIIEEGFDLGQFDRIVTSIAEAAKANGVAVVTGDTKTVDAGSADGIFINTAGIGVRIASIDLGMDRIEVDDQVLISGTIGDHGMTIMSQREGMQFESQLRSDCAGLADLTGRLLANVDGIKFMRDPTRGGLAATLNEIAQGSGLSMEAREENIPVRPVVRGAADMLGFDVLNIANEGKFVAVVSPGGIGDALEICRAHPLGGEASVIGRIIEKQDVPLVELITKIGGRRIVQMPYGRELPRIC